MGLRSNTRLGLKKAVKGGSDLVNEIRCGGGTPMTREGLGGTGTRKAAGGPTGQHARTRIWAIVLETRGPMHEHSARARQDITLTATPANKTTETELSTRQGKNQF